MRISLAIGGLLATSAFASTALANCDQPSVVAVPEGENSTMEILLAAQTSVKDYMAAMEAYLACINEELEAAGDDAAASFKSLMVTRHNTAVAEMETVAAAFNEQVQAYRAANPEEGE
jgi:hypothetical protein